MKYRCSLRHGLVCMALIVLLSTRTVASDVLIVGDSMMKSVARALKKECAKRELSVETETSIGSGLARLDLLDWHQTVRNLVEEHNPSTVFIMMGANDNQAMQTAGGVVRFGAEGWGLEYGRRVGKLMDVVDAEKTQVYWLGLPCMREAKMNSDTISISRIVSHQAAARKHVHFFSTYMMFSKKGDYSAYILQKSGMPLDVRSADGVHLNPNGAKLLAETVMLKFDKQ